VATPDEPLRNKWKSTRRCGGYPISLVEGLKDVWTHEHEHWIQRVRQESRKADSSQSKDSRIETFGLVEVTLPPDLKNLISKLT